MNELVKVNIDFIADDNLHEGIIKLELTNFIESQLLPMVEKEVEKYEENTIYIDQLDVQLSSSLLNYQKDTYSAVQRVLSDKLHEHLYRISSKATREAEINDIIKGTDLEQQSTLELSEEESLFLFLTTGVMPWYEQERLKERVKKIQNKEDLSLLVEAWRLMCVKKNHNIYSFITFLNAHQLLSAFVAQLFRHYPHLKGVFDTLTDDEKKAFLLQVYHGGEKTSQEGIVLHESLLRVVLKRNFKPSIVDSILKIVNSESRLTELCKVELMLYIKKQRKKLKKGLFVKNKKTAQKLLQLEESLCIDEEKIEEDKLALMNVQQWKASFIEQQVLHFLLKKELDPAFEAQLTEHPILLFQFLLVIAQRTKERKMKVLKKYPQLYLIGENAIIHQLLFAIIKEQPEGFLNSKLIQQVNESTDIEHVRSFLISSLGNKLDLEVTKVLTYELLLLKLLLTPEQLLKKSIKFDIKWGEVLEYFKLFSHLNKEEKTKLLLSSTTSETIFVLALQSDHKLFNDLFEQKTITSLLFSTAQKLLSAYQFYNTHSNKAAISAEEFLEVIQSIFSTFKVDDQIRTSFLSSVNDHQIVTSHSQESVALNEEFTEASNVLDVKLSKVFEHFRANPQLTKIEKTDFLLTSVSIETIFEVILTSDSDVFFEIFDEMQIGLTLFSNRQRITTLYLFYQTFQQGRQVTAEDFVKVVITHFPSFRNKAKVIFESLDLENLGSSSATKEVIALQLKQLLQKNNSIAEKRIEIVDYFAQHSQLSKQEKTGLLLSSSTTLIIFKLIIFSDRTAVSSPESKPKLLEVLDQKMIGEFLFSRKNDVITLYQYCMHQTQNSSFTSEDFVELISDYFPTYEDTISAILEYNELVGGIHYKGKDSDAEVSIEHLFQQSVRIDRQLSELLEFLKRNLSISKKKRTKLLLSSSRLLKVAELFIQSETSHFLNIFSRKLIGAKFFTDRNNVKTFFQLFKENSLDKASALNQFVDLVVSEFPFYETHVRSVLDIEIVDERHQKAESQKELQLQLDQILKQSIEIIKKREATEAYFKRYKNLSRGEKTQLLLASASIEMILELILSDESAQFLALFDTIKLGTVLFENNASVVKLYQFLYQQDQYVVNNIEEFVATIATFFPTFEAQARVLLEKTFLKEEDRLANIKDFVFNGNENLKLSFTFTNVQTQKLLTISHLFNADKVQIQVDGNTLGIVYLEEVFSLYNSKNNTLLMLANAINAILPNFKSEDRKSLEKVISWIKEEDTSLSKLTQKEISILEIQLWLQLIINRKEGLFDLEQKEMLMHYFKQLSLSELKGQNSYSVRQKNRIFCYLSLSYKTNYSLSLQRLERKLNQEFSKLFTALQIADYIKLLQNDLFHVSLHQTTYQAGNVMKRVEEVFPQINFSRTKIYKITCELLKLNTEEKHIQELNDKLEQSFGQRKNMTMEVKNAGLVILVPYLPLFLKHRGLLTEDNKAFKDEESLLKAIGLMLYLSQKNLLVEDDRQLIIPKILCGIDIETPVVLDFELTEEEKEGADHLLKTVISHWSALKKMEPDSLRIMFFVRDGQLTLKDDWYLEVEPNTYDIFMKMLPWSIKINMLPWMECKIFCEWGK
ncbi:contractile injection system tape measure protein [Flammeovirga aprica]|uniref:Uncharacterized protein n=1 Tax=Flammeovirga aprica JL-4 TaxID=694437 RepID=A0A7X9RX07_9BACT|nr:contractile injection system tape measure protein [Flammeovirga aprica]NME70267.1 hypothetical protein [Flammeovirga aprica JL-4]